MSSMYQLSELSYQLQYFIGLHQMQSVVSRRFDNMGSMVGFTDFLVLYHLSQAEGQQLRRVDLADKMGMTASGVTRLLVPMEKLLLVSREANPRDARVSMAKLTSGGQRVLMETLERAERVAQELIPEEKKTTIETMAAKNEEIRRSALI